MPELLELAFAGGGSFLHGAPELLELVFAGGGGFPHGVPELLELAFFDGERFGMGAHEPFELLAGSGVAGILEPELLELVFLFRKLAQVAAVELVVLLAKRGEGGVHAPVFPEDDLLFGEHGRVGAAERFELGFFLGEGGVVPAACAAEHGFLFAERVVQAVDLRLLAVEQRRVARGFGTRILEGPGDGAQAVVPRGELRLVLGLEYARHLCDDGLARFLTGVLRGLRGRRGHGRDVVHSVAEPAVFLGKQGKLVAQLLRLFVEHALERFGVGVLLVEISVHLRAVVPADGGTEFRPLGRDAHIRAKLGYFVVLIRHNAPPSRTRSC